MRRPDDMLLRPAVQPVAPAGTQTACRNFGNADGQTCCNAGRPFAFAVATFKTTIGCNREIVAKEANMADNTHWDTFKAESGNVLNKVKMLIHEGNVRRVVVKHGGRTVAEFPLTAGVLGAVLAPVLAAIGALVALLQECTIEVEREQWETAREETPQTAARS
jgi:hypothetical protein